MKKLGLLLVVSVIFSLSAFAGEYLMNDTGDTVYGLRVIFSEPVSLTGFGDILTVVQPTEESIEFTFSGGELEVWDGHWLNWEPATVVLLSHEWVPGTSAGTIFQQSYKTEIHEVFDEQQLNPEYWALIGTDSRVAVQLIDGTLRLSGVPSRVGKAQTGISTVACFDATTGFEAVLVARFFARQSSVIVEVNSCGSYQHLTLACHDMGYGLWWCTAPKTCEEARSSPFLLSRNLYGIVTLRLTYDGATRTVSASVDNRVIGTGSLPEGFREVVLRVFVQSGAQHGALGMVDARIDELHIGWGNDAE